MSILSRYLANSAWRRRCRSSALLGALAFAAAACSASPLHMPAGATQSGAARTTPLGASGGAGTNANGSPAALPPLVVNDAQAANPELAPVRVGGAAGTKISDQSVALPPGFSMSVLASGLSAPRFMAFDPAGNLLVGSNDGFVYRLPGAGGSVAPLSTPPAPLLAGLTAPHSVAFYGGYLYVAETGSVSRYRYGSDGTLGARETVIGDLPTDGGHFTRTVIFGPAGELYLGVGSSCNICSERDQRRAAISRYAANGSGYQRVAWGTRNPVGLAIQPDSGALWATVNERDYEGDERPPDLVTVVRQGDNFGWPACMPPDATPQSAGADCRAVTPPTVGIQAHSAPLGLAFYTGSQFPADYAGDLFVVQHGSWNRSPPAPPQIVRIHFQSANPVSVRAFATGWQVNDQGARWGRPVGIVVAPDGSLIVSDDQEGFIYRIAYGGSG